MYKAFINFKLNEMEFPKNEGDQEHPQKNLKNIEFVPLSEASPSPSPLKLRKLQQNLRNLNNLKSKSLN